MATLTPQDEFIKTALRLPRDLHAQVQASAEELGRSMNAEIIARLQSSFDATTVVDAPQSLGMVITVDSRGYPISWNEIHAYIEAYRKISGVDPHTLEVRVITPEVVSSSTRPTQYEAIEHNLKEFYLKKRRDAAAAREQSTPDKNGDLPRTVFTKGPAGKTRKTIVTTKK